MWSTLCFLLFVYVHVYVLRLWLHMQVKRALFSKTNIELVIAHFIVPLGAAIRALAFEIGAFCAVISRANKLTR